MDVQGMLARALAANKKAAAAGEEVPSVDVASALPSVTTAPENPQLTEILHVIKELEGALTEENEGIAMYAGIIHKKMIEYPELVHLLDDDAIAVVYKAALLQTGTKLVKEKKATERKTKAIQLAAAQDWD